MPELSKDVLTLLTFLFPGFLVASIFHSLSSHKRSSLQVELVIQAIVLTFIVKLLVLWEQGVSLWIGHLAFAIGTWTATSELAASIGTALVFGVVLGASAHDGRFHDLLRRCKLTSSSSHESDWCYALTKYPRHVTLEFKDGKRLYGFPEAWPTDPEHGHFFIVDAVWTHDPRPQPMRGTEGLLVSVQDIAHVEIMSAPKENEDGNKGLTTSSKFV